MKRVFLLAAALVLLAGCIPSVNPYYTEKDLVFEPKLVGDWQVKKDSDQPERWHFEKMEDQDKAYKLIVTQEKTKRGELTAHLFKLGKEYFLDVVASKVDFAPDQADIVGFSMYPGHLLIRVEQIEPELQLAAFDWGWLKDSLTKDPKILAHHREGDTILLTASTGDLQRFVLDHLGEGQLFEKGGALARAGGAASGDK